MTRALKITKGHATGNRFVIFSDPVSVIDLSVVEYASLTHRHGDAGIDGVIRAIRSEQIPEGCSILEADTDAEWFMDHRKSDGSTAAVCGNALRVFVAFLMTEGLVDLAHGDRIAVGTRDGVKDVQVGSNGVFRVDLGRWRSRDGSANVTMALESISVEPFDPLVDDGIGRLSVQLNETVANECSSWAMVAVAAALDTRHRVGRSAPNNWRVETLGGPLGIQLFPTEEGEHVSLSGHVELAPTETVEF